MKKIIITQGIPASGKTTWAKEWVSEDPEHRVRFNRDDIRNMLGVYWVPSREKLINSIYLDFLSEAIASGYDIVIDNMNLNKNSIREIESEVNGFNEWISLAVSPEERKYRIEYKKFLDVPLQTCIERDSRRSQPIGEKTIRSIYDRYKNEYNL